MWLIGAKKYTDNSLVDPWLVSQIILQNTEKLSPLIDIQPVYMHAYAVAKMVASFGHLLPTTRLLEHGCGRVQERPSRTQ
jgi:hypothetical protein